MRHFSGRVGLDAAHIAWGGGLMTDTGAWVGLGAPTVLAMEDTSSRSVGMRASGPAADLGVCGLSEPQISSLVIIQGSSKGER